jgi:hypothetical protein
VRLAALLLVVVLFHLLLPLLIFVPVTFTRIWTFSYEVIRLTTPVAHPFGAGLVVFPPPLLEDLVKALNDKSHLVVELGGINWKPTWCRLLLLFFRCFECNGLHLRCGGGALHQVDNMFGVFDCRCFDPGGSLDRRVNCRRVSQPRWVGARRSTKGGETAKGETRGLRVALRPGRVRLQ